MNCTAVAKGVDQQFMKILLPLTEKKSNPPNNIVECCIDDDGIDHCADNIDDSVYNKSSSHPLNVIYINCKNNEKKKYLL